MKEDYEKLVEKSHDELERANDVIKSLQSQLKITRTENARLTQLIQILSEVYQRWTHLPSAKYAIEQSKQADEKSYHELKVLEIMVENIERGIKGYED